MKTNSEWLKEWEIHRMMPPRKSNEWKEDAGTETSVEQGSIWLAPCSWNSEMSRVEVEFLVLGRWGDREGDQTRWMIAPYGPMSSPADPSELQTGRDQVGQRVLCLWNARIVPQVLLQKAQLTGKAEHDEVEDALAVWDNRTIGTALPLRLRSLVGPVFEEQHAASDQRLEYFKEESGVFEAV